MRKQVLSGLTLVLVVLACAGEASALVQRTFVSKFGLDTNTCGATDPCRTFAAAIAQTQAGGEVIALDSAGYGPVTITKSISLISPPGIYAGITTTAPFADAITVSAGVNDVVVLKGLSLSGLGLGSDGVNFTSGKTLRVEGLTISGFLDIGILFFPATAARLTVTDSLIRDNGHAGIFVQALSGATAQAVIERTRSLGNQHGVEVHDNSVVTVRDTVAAGNTNLGFFVATVTGVLNLENCLTTGNDYGLWSFHGLMRVAGTTVTGNANGVATFSGSVLSRGNNTVEGNATDGAFTGAFAAK